MDRNSEESERLGIPAVASIGFVILGVGSQHITPMMDLLPCCKQSKPWAEGMTVCVTAFCMKLCAD